MPWEKGYEGKYEASGAVDCDSLMVSNGELLISIIGARAVAVTGWMHYWSHCLSLDIFLPLLCTGGVGLNLTSLNLMPQLYQSGSAS